MREKIKHYIKEIALFFIVMTVLANALSFYKSGELNKEALSLKSVILLNEQEYLLPHAKPILIHFWATWCPTCKLEASNIETLAKSYEVLSIAVKSGSDADVQAFMKEQNLHFRVLNDEDGAYAQKFNIAAYPTTFIYNKEKNLVFSEVGYTSTFGLYLRMWWSSL